MIWMSRMPQMRRPRWEFRRRHRAASGGPQAAPAAGVRVAEPRARANRNTFMSTNITAETVKQLRERTGAGMMECKKALVETKGDLDAAAELMRKQGLAKADKKAARVAAEGVIVIEKAADGRTAAMVEINCETDFVAREQDFRGFAQAVAAKALATGPASLETLLAVKLDNGETIEER